MAEAERRALYVSIKAYDNILALQQKYDGTTMQGTAYALLGQIAAACGLTLGQTEAEIGALNPNAALVCQLSGADGLSTWRECAAAVAQLVGGFAAADRAGRLVLRTFAEKKPCAALTAAAREGSGLGLCLPLRGAEHRTDDGSFAAGRSQDTGLTMRISNMTLAEKGLPATRQQITDNLFAALQRLDYVPATVTMPATRRLSRGPRGAADGGRHCARDARDAFRLALPRAADLKGRGPQPLPRRHNGRRDGKKPAPLTEQRRE